MSSRRFERRGVRVAARVACTACLVVSAGLMAHATAARAATLPPAHVGVPVAAPAAPAVGGAPADTVAYAWQRCADYRDAVATDGARDLWELGDDTGTAAPDAIGGATGTYSRAAHASVADGALVGGGDPAASFDGLTDAVSVPPTVDFTGTSPFTIEVWARPRSVDAVARYLFTDESTSAPRSGTGIWLSSAGLGFERWSNGVKSGITLGAGLPLHVWSLVTATYDGATMRLFVDGSQVGSRPSTTGLAAVAGPAWLGAGAGGRSGLFAGDLDELALYPLALARAHVAAHTAVGTTAPCTTIPSATASTYTPTTAELGDELSAATTSTNANGSATATAATAGPVDDGQGNLVAVSLGGVTPGTTVGGTVQLTALPAGAPGDRVEFDVDGQPRYAKPAEPPYQYTWYTNAEANGPHTATVELWGPGARTPVTASVTVTVANRTVYPTPLPSGEESMYALFGEGDPATANNLLDNVWPARGYALPSLGWPLTWTEDPYGDAYWRFFFYGLQPLPTLLYEWKTTGNTAYLDKLIAILRSYVANDQVRPVDTATFDNDHAAAYRTMALVQFYVKLKNAGVLPADLDAGLVQSLQKLGAFLAVPGHFEADYNHGFNEGAALLLLADNFPLWSDSAAWRTLALQRLGQMLANTIDADGVEVENSPFYHLYVLGLVGQISRWAATYEPALAPSYSAAAARMLAYAAEITQPNGYLPMLGATATTYVPSQDPTVYGPLAAADAGFDFAFTRGAHGAPPPDGTVLYPVSGLFVMRSPLGAPANLANQTYVTFNAGTYRTSHSDLDALGLTLYSNGSTLLPTSGLYTYTQQPDLEYFHGTRSHNTVVVDGLDQAAGSAQAGSHGSTGGATWATGTSDLYAGVHHRRTVAILRQGLTLVVDHLTSAASHSYAQTWHLAPDAEVAVSGGDAYVSDPSGTPTLTIREADPAGATMTAIKGQLTPVLQGWSSSTYAFKQPAWALEFRRTASSAAFTTLLAAGPYAAQPSTVLTSSVTGGEQVDICVGGTVGYRVFVPTDPAAATTVAGGACAPAPAAAPVDPARQPLPAPPLTLSAADQAAFKPLPARNGAIPVLLFHSVCATSGCTSYNATPTEFARILLMLQRAGYHTISLAQYDQWWHGRAVSLPSEPVLLTFDDGRFDAYRGADATLAALGDQATMFDATGWTDGGLAKFLRWNELAAMQASGRWDIQLHAGQGHVNITTGLDSTGAPVLHPYYAWLAYDPARYPSGAHLEPYADWRTRAEGDLAQGLALLRAHIPGYAPTGFAVPYGDYGQYHTNDARIPVELKAYLGSHFGVYFVQPQRDPDFSTPGKEPWRYTIESTTTAADVYAWLAEHA